MIGFYNYTVILTYIGTVSGFVGLTYAMNKNITAALICLLICGFCDMFDGKIASTMKRTKSEKRFGVQIDSLSDLICFGVLPAIIMLQSAGGKIPHMIIGAAFMLGALIRLAWFNVDEEERQDKEDGSRKVYLGLPVTSSSLIIPFFIGIERIFELPAHIFTPIVAAVVAVLFITPFKLKKPGLIGKIAMMVIGAGVLAVVIIGVAS